MLDVFLFTFFFTVGHFLSGGRQHPAAPKFYVVTPTKNVSFCFFSLPLAPFLVELRWSVALLSLFLCFSLSLYSKFVDMTINLSLILQRTRIQKHFPLAVFVFIDYLVVSASQDADGHTLSRQNNLAFGIGLHVVGVRTVVRANATSNQILLLSQDTNLSQQWGSAARAFRAGAPLICLLSINRPFY